MESTHSLSAKEGFVRVRIENFKLWYIIYNPEKMHDHSGFNCPILVIHGGPGMPHGYLKESFLDACMQDRAVIFYDQLGCGNSDKPPEEHYYSMSASVADLHCLIQELASLAHEGSDERAFQLHIAGHSFGGMLAYDYMSSSLFRDSQQSIGLRSAVLLSTPTSTGVSMESSLKCKQRLIGDMVSSNMGCSSFVAMEDLDARAAEKFVDTHMYRRAAVMALGAHNGVGGAGAVSSSLPTLESLVDRSVPSWDGVHTKDLRAWAAWRESGGSSSHSVTAADCAVGGAAGCAMHVCLITGQFDFVNSRCIQHWRDVSFPPASGAGPAGQRLFEASIIPEASHMNVLEQPERVCAAVDAFLRRVEESDAAAASAAVP
jgi:pimeloyl-ACP methyl ester carboxylesterase